MVTGPNRIHCYISQEQANESLAHALQAGEYITGFGKTMQKYNRRKP